MHHPVASLAVLYRWLFLQIYGAMIVAYVNELPNVGVVAVFHFSLDSDFVSLVDASFAKNEK